jgi:threonine/homoserine/homoserine lactone efflux protein
LLEALQYLASGVAFGAVGGLSPGPTTTLVVAQTLRYGLREGVKVAIAPLLTDAPIVIVAMLVMRNLSSGPLLAGISAIGSAFLLYLAYEAVNAAPPGLTSDRDGGPASIRKGFLANFFNPHPWMFWLTVGGPMMQQALESSVLAGVLFIVGQYVLLVGAKILIAVLVNRGRSKLGRGYTVVMRLLALALVVFAVLFARQAAMHLGWLGGYSI